MSPPVLCQLVMYPHARAHTHARLHTWPPHTNTHSQRVSAIAPSLLCSSVLFLPFMFGALLDWIRPLLVSVWYAYALCYSYDITLRPHGALYTYTGDSETPEVYHTAPQRLRGHFRQSHIQAGRAFYVPSLIRGFYGKTLTILSSYYCGGGWEREEGMWGTGWVVNTMVAWGQFI